MLIDLRLDLKEFKSVNLGYPRITTIRIITGEFDPGSE